MYKSTQNRVNKVNNGEHIQMQEGDYLNVGHISSSAKCSILQVSASMNDSWDKPGQREPFLGHSSQSSLGLSGAHLAEC